jgi:hypothetical protein
VREGRWNACGAEYVVKSFIQAPTGKSFLLLFFKKEALACLKTSWIYL